MRIYVFVSFFLISLIYALGCSQSKGGSENTLGKSIYKTHCQLCHGPEGKLGLNGALDLSSSKLSEKERTLVISKGRNTMLSYENILSAEEITAVSKFTMSFK